jgi:hypothetical protein
MTTLTEVFPCFFLSCKANARVKPAETGHRPHNSLVVVLFYVFFCVSIYCLFCNVPCIVCVYMCTEQLPPGGYSILQLNISYHNLPLKCIAYRVIAIPRFCSCHVSIMLTHVVQSLVWITCEQFNRFFQDAALSCLLSLRAAREGQEFTRFLSWVSFYCFGQIRIFNFWCLNFILHLEKYKKKDTVSALW